MISHQHRKYFHGAVLSPLLRFDKLIFNDVKVNDMIFSFSPARTFGTNKEGVKRIKHLLKQLDFDYPMDGDVKSSSEKLTDKELVAHIEWIKKTVAESGEILPVDELEWERLKQQAGIV